MLDTYTYETSQSRSRWSSAGERNFHARLEWVSAQDMEKAIDVIVNLAKIWEERS
jgi:di/tripeptidase